MDFSERVKDTLTITFIRWKLVKDGKLKAHPREFPYSCYIIT